MNITDLPPEMLVAIVQNLEGRKDYYNFSLTCSRFYETISGDKERLLFEIIFKHDPSMNEFEEPTLKNRLVKKKIKNIIINRRIVLNGNRYRQKTIKWIRPLPCSISHPLTIMLLLVCVVVSLMLLDFLIYDSPEYRRCMKNYLNSKECEFHLFGTKFKIFMVLSLAATIIGVPIMLYYVARRDHYDADMRNFTTGTAAVLGQAVQKVKNCFYREKLFS